MFRLTYLFALIIFLWIGYLLLKADHKTGFIKQDVNSYLIFLITLMVLLFAGFSVYYSISYKQNLEYKLNTENNINFYKEQFNNSQIFQKSMESLEQKYLDVRDDKQSLTSKISKCVFT